MTVIVIIAVLFAALFIVIPLVEKHGKRHSPEELAKLSRWFMPLIGIMLFLSVLKMMGVF